jgi:hypothetical protein
VASIVPLVSQAKKPFFPASSKKREESYVLSLTNLPHLVNYEFHQSTPNILYASQTSDVQAVAGSEIAEGIEVIGI